MPLSAQRQSRARPEVRLQLRWLERLNETCTKSYSPRAEPVVLAGDTTLSRPRIDVYKPEHWAKDALFLPEVRAAFANLVAMGWNRRGAHTTSDKRIYHVWDYSETIGCAMLFCASIICF